MGNTIAVRKEEYIDRNGYVLVSVEWLEKLEQVFEACAATEEGGAIPLPPQVGIAFHATNKLLNPGNYGRSYTSNIRKRLPTLAHEVIGDFKSKMKSDTFRCPGGHRRDGQPWDEVEYNDDNFTYHDPNKDVGIIHRGECHGVITVEWDEESIDGYVVARYPVASSEPYPALDKEIEEYQKTHNPTFYEPGSCARALGLEDQEFAMSGGVWFEWYARHYALSSLEEVENRHRISFSQRGVKLQP
jgi:hypothetical protein